MFDQKILKQLENMINQMKPSQKEKLADMMRDKESIKNALSDANVQKARELAKSLNVKINNDDITKVIDELEQHDKRKDDK